MTDRRTRPSGVGLLADRREPVDHRVRAAGRRLAFTSTTTTSERAA